MVNIDVPNSRVNFYAEWNQIDLIEVDYCNQNHCHHSSKFVLLNPYHFEGLDSVRPVKDNFYKFQTMKGLRATESHSADRAAQPKQKVNQATELENKVKLESCRF